MGQSRTDKAHPGEPGGDGRDAWSTRRRWGRRGGGCIPGGSHRFGFLLGGEVIVESFGFIPGPARCPRGARRFHRGGSAPGHRRHRRLRQSRELPEPRPARRNALYKASHEAPGFQSTGTRINLFGTERSEPPPRCPRRYRGAAGIEEGRASGGDSEGRGWGQRWQQQSTGRTRGRDTPGDTSSSRAAGFWVWESLTAHGRARGWSVLEAGGDGAARVVAAGGDRGVVAPCSVPE